MQISTITLKDMLLIYRASFDYLLRRVYDNLNIDESFKSE